MLMNFPNFYLTVTHTVNYITNILYIQLPVKRISLTFQINCSSKHTLQTTQCVSTVNTVLNITLARQRHRTRQSHTLTLNEGCMRALLEKTTCLLFFLLLIVQLTIWNLQCLSVLFVSRVWRGLVKGNGDLSLWPLVTERFHVLILLIFIQA